MAGLADIPLAIEAAALAALAAYALCRCFSGDTFNAGSRLPFGLFLAPTIWLGWFLEAMQAAQL
jgi:leader peptidase (prepilin peptidase) / N-methyltransferase